MFLIHFRWSDDIIQNGRRDLISWHFESWFILYSTFGCSQPNIVLTPKLNGPKFSALQWRHNGRDVVSNHWRRDCLLICLFRRRSKKTSKLRVTDLREGNSPETGDFPTQRASNAENVSIWWRHHGFKHTWRYRWVYRSIVDRETFVFAWAVRPHYHGDSVPCTGRYATTNGTTIYSENTAPAF